jgi:hypothetical protein
MLLLDATSGRSGLMVVMVMLVMVMLVMWVHVVWM